VVSIKLALGGHESFTQMILNDAKIIAKLDTGRVRDSLLALKEQVGAALGEASRVKFPASFAKASDIVVAGMGGSTLGAHMIEAIYGDALRVPFCFINGYHLPGWVGKNTLVILSSYSGTTEETLACFDEAKKRGAMLCGITTGGPLAAKLKAIKAPSYVFSPQHNPGNQPRMGLGYMFSGLVALLVSLGALPKSAATELGAAAAKLTALNAGWRVEKSAASNDAKKIAAKLKGSIPVIVTAEHLAGNGHVLQNQIHESAKEFSVAFPLPELNHHLMEGLGFPRTAKTDLVFLFIGSDLYSKKLKQRMRITQKVVTKQGCRSVVWRARGATRAAEALQMLAFGGWISFYMAMVNRVNPSFIPWVNFFKKELKRG